LITVTKENTAEAIPFWLVDPFFADGKLFATRVLAGANGGFRTMFWAKRLL
jgi:hypothetical protein